MSIIILCLVLFVLVVVWVVTASYAIVWYEYSNSDPAAIDERFSSFNVLLAIQLLLSESCALAFTILCYPLGWFFLPLPGHGEGEQTPVLLLHGLFHNGGCWFVTAQRLRRLGYDVYTLNLSPREDMDILVERVALRVDELRHSLGVEKVDLVGHSMGGIIARYYVQSQGGAPYVRNCVLLATPHGGSKLAPFAVTALGKLLIPGSTFLTTLAARPLPEDVNFTAICSRHDNMVLPWQNATLDGVKNVELDALGHTGVLYHPDAFAAIVAGLKGPALAHS
jgi:pimeloyl-ACP methyl ester carboxylesterase